MLSQSLTSSQATQCWLIKAQLPIPSQNWRKPKRLTDLHIFWTHPHISTKPSSNAACTAQVNDVSWLPWSDSLGNTVLKGQTIPAAIALRRLTTNQAKGCYLAMMLHAQIACNCMPATAGVRHIRRIDKRSYRPACC